MSDAPLLLIRQLDAADERPPPAYKSDGAAGLDLSAALPADVTETIAPGARSLIGTGFAIGIPFGYEGQIRPRSGLALEHGLTVLNTPGTIDSDYRGELKVLLINHGDQSVTIRRGMRIAQLVIAPVARVETTLVETLDQTIRGHDGFGSTGKI